MKPVRDTSQPMYSQRRSFSRSGVFGLDSGTGIPDHHFLYTHILHANHHTTHEARHAFDRPIRLYDGNDSPRAQVKNRLEVLDDFREIRVG